MAEKPLVDDALMAAHVIRELGIAALICLTYINAGGALACFVLGWPPLAFVVGLLLAFLGIFLSYLFAQLWIFDPKKMSEIDIIAHLSMLISPPVLSLLAFILGVYGSAAHP